MALRTRKVPSLSKNRPQVTHGHVLFPFPFFVSSVAASSLDRLRIRLPSKITKLIYLCKHRHQSHGWKNKVP